MLLTKWKLNFLRKLQNGFTGHEILKRSGEHHVRTLEEPIGCGSCKPKSVTRQTSRLGDSCASRIVVCILQKPYVIGGVRSISLVDRLNLLERLEGMRVVSPLARSSFADVTGTVAKGTGTGGKQCGNYQPI